MKLLPVFPRVIWRLPGTPLCRAQDYKLWVRRHPKRLLGRRSIKGNFLMAGRAERTVCWVKGSCQPEQSLRESLRYVTVAVRRHSLAVHGIAAFRA